MPDKQDIAFTVIVDGREWDEVLGGWRCPALKIPGATVEGVYVRGNRVEPHCYQVKHGAGVVRWIGSEVPERAGILIELTKELSPKDLTLRWKKFALFVPIFAALAGASFQYLISSPRTPAESSGAPAHSLTCEKSVRITVPVEMQRVPIREEIKGTFQDLPKGYRIWTLVYPASVGRFYPQNEAKVTGNTWSSEVVIGLNHEAGRQFLIYAVLADERAHNELSIYAERAVKLNDSPGLIDLPAGTRVCQMITVTRK